MKDGTRLLFRAHRSAFIVSDGAKKKAPDVRGLLWVLAAD